MTVILYNSRFIYIYFQIISKWHIFYLKISNLINIISKTYILFENFKSLSRQNYIIKIFI